MSGDVAGYRLTLQLQGVNLTLIGPFFRPRDQSSMDGIIPHIQPLLLIRFRRPQHVVEESAAQIMAFEDVYRGESHSELIEIVITSVH